MALSTASKTRASAIILIESLQARWDGAEAAVLTDWCEEAGLPGAARLLRQKDRESRWRGLNMLAGCIGVRDLSVGPPHFGWDNERPGTEIRLTDVCSAYPAEVAQTWGESWNAVRGSAAHNYLLSVRHEPSADYDDPAAGVFFGGRYEQQSGAVGVAVIGVRPVTLGPGESYEVEVISDQVTKHLWLRFGRGCLDALAVKRLDFGHWRLLQNEHPVPARALDERGFLDLEGITSSLPTLSPNVPVHLEVVNDSDAPVHMTAGFIALVLNPY